MYQNYTRLLFFGWPWAQRKFGRWVRGFGFRVSKVCVYTEKSTFLVFDLLVGGCRLQIHMLWCDFTAETYRGPWSGLPFRSRKIVPGKGIFFRNPKLKCQKPKMVITSLNSDIHNDLMVAKNQKTTPKNCQSRGELAPIKNELLSYILIKNQPELRKKMKSK